MSTLKNLPNALSQIHRENQDLQAEVAALNAALLKSIGEVSGGEEHVAQLKAQIEHLKQVVISDRIQWEDFPPASRLVFAQILKG
jgi:peptidoglycan hydrolase CwlO-like protein